MMMISVVRPSRSPPPPSPVPPPPPKFTPTDHQPSRLTVHRCTDYIIVIIIMYLYVYDIIIMIDGFFSPPQQHIVPATVICDVFFTQRVLLLNYTIQRATIILISQYYDDG